MSQGEQAQRRAMESLAAVLLVGILLQLAGCSPPPDPVTCTHGTSNCTVTNTYGSFTDRTICHAANVVYPRTEQELVAAVAAAAAAKRKMKVATKHSHSGPKLACPGGSEGTIISTTRLNRTVSIDAERQLITVESGMVLRDLIQTAAAAGLSLPHSPYWYGLTIGGLLATGAHGSGLWGKGGAVHEYVVGLRIVTPAPACHGFAMVRELGADHPDLDAAKVSLGVLGVVSQVTLALQPLFKRSVTFVKRNESDFTAQVTEWGRLHEFADVIWQPRNGTVTYRQDDRVDVSTPGDGLNDLFLFRPAPTALLVSGRATEEQLQENGTDTARCAAAQEGSTSRLQAFGFTNDGVVFTGYPVVGYQHRIQASGSCIDGPEDDLGSSCAWDPRIRGLFMYNSGFSVALSKAPAFVADMQQLRDLNPDAFCSAIDNRVGVVLRYVRASSAYLGKPEDCVDVDILFYRSHTDGMPRAHADVVDEIEQLALGKYGGLPHWGKNRNFAFDGAIARYPKAHKFLKVKNRYDPDGLFSSEWTDQVLGINGTPNIIKDRCAIEGLCVCSDDSHCAPEQGYFCRPGKVYKNARVCSSEEDY
ncbi:probable L-gulonolactone oxidase 4 [Hordeum vulgare subsp. vulgare]|uniref:L-gulonolactone oxidase n=1 Tax=Hordeum vulgare subsp. vulgare TaxID=112509 RepID=A0A8I6WDE4_HORVV|nr:probable L-gulonolactone oxidase 4 [Hordeum vulgare subsp. vulgare]